jgi:twitching motility protein PilT
MNKDQLDTLLSTMLRSASGVSDLILTMGRPPQVEVYGELKPVSVPGVEVLTAEHTGEVVQCLVKGNTLLERQLAEAGACDCAWHLPTGERFRINIFKVRGTFSIVLRALPSEIPTFERLKLPKTVEEIPKLLNGLVLVTGATGSGKSTTLAAIVDRINSTRAAHVVTLEDPVEFVHGHKMATINQRELGRDFPRFVDGLRSALRQAPKVILVGEVRDRDTVEIALKAAETGHLVMSTLHTIDAGETINRIIALFSQDEQNVVKNRLAQSLRYVVSQRLMPRKSGGRIAALEIMGSSLRVRELILSGETLEKTFYGVIQDAKPHGWQTFDQHIVELFQQDLITAEVARSHCSDPSVVSRAIDQLRAARGEQTSDIDNLQMAFTKKLKRN